MVEELLGRIRVARPNPNPFAQTSYIYEDLHFTSERVIVSRRIGYEKKSKKRRVLGEIASFLSWGGSALNQARRTDEEYAVMLEKPFLDLPLEDILKADEHNYAISKSDIIQVELKSSPLKKHERLSKWLKKLEFTATRKLVITTNREKHEWLLFPSLGIGLEDCENILGLAFPDKLS